MLKEKKSILLVDDEEDLTWSISKYLRKNELLFEVTSVSSGDDAIKMLDQIDIDLVISDIKMPGMSGLELLSIVNENHPATKVIIMTAFGSEVLKEEASKSGALYYLEKPFELVVLREIIYSALEIPEKKITKSLVNSRVKQIIAFHCQSGRTSQLSFQQGLRKGIICFKHGEIIHAECGDLEGETALLSILHWGKVDSYARLEHSNTKHTIRRNWQSLLGVAMMG